MALQPKSMKKNILILILSLTVLTLGVLANEKHKKAIYYKRLAMKYQVDAKRSAELAEKLQDQVELQKKQSEKLNEKAMELLEKARNN